MRTASAVLHLNWESVTGFRCFPRGELSSLGIPSRSCGEYFCQDQDDQNSDLESTLKALS